MTTFEHGKYPLAIGIEDFPMNPAGRNLHVDFPITKACKEEVYKVSGTDRFAIGVDWAHHDDKDSRYQMHLRRGRQFAWDDIMPAVAEVLAKHKLKHEKKG